MQYCIVTPHCVFCNLAGRKLYINPKYIERELDIFFFFFQTKKGIKGFVGDADTKDKISGVTIKVDDRSHDVRSHAGGDYYRILNPGTYEVTAQKDGYQPQRKSVTVQEGADAVEVNFLLTKEGGGAGGEADVSPKLAGRESNTDNTLLKQIQNIDQQLLSSASQPWRNDLQQFSPTVTIGGMNAQNIPKLSEAGADETNQSHDFFLNDKDDEQLMNDFDLEKQDFFDQKTDLETTDQAKKKRKKKH